MTTKNIAALLASTAVLFLVSGDASALPKNPICSYDANHEIADASVRDAKGNFVPCIRPAPMLVCAGVSVILSVGACEPDYHPLPHCKQSWGPAAFDTPRGAESSSRGWEGRHETHSLASRGIRRRVR